MKSALALLTTIFSISSFAQMALTSSAALHQPNVCPVLDGMYETNLYGDKQLDLYRTEMTENGIRYNVVIADEEGKATDTKYRILADGKLHTRLAPYADKPWIHSCIDSKTMVIDYLYEDEVYAKRTLTQVDYNTFIFKHELLDKGVVKVFTGTFSRIANPHP